MNYHDQLKTVAYFQPPLPCLLTTDFIYPAADEQVKENVIIY